MGQSNEKPANLPVVEPLAKEIILDTGVEILLGANESSDAAEAAAESMYEGAAGVAAGVATEPCNQITYVLLGDDDIDRSGDIALKADTLNEINLLLAEQGVPALITPKLHPVRISAVMLYYIEICGNVMDLGDFQLVSQNDLRVLSQ